MNRLFLIIALCLIIIPQNIIGYCNYSKDIMNQNKKAVPVTVFIEPDNKTFKIGERLQNQLTFTNNSTVKQEMTFFRPTFWYPIVKAVNTDRIFVVSGELYDGPAMPVHIMLNPKESVKISSAPVHLIRVENQINEGKMLCEPGSYRVQYKIPLTINTTNQTLTSNIVQIVITE